MSRSVSRAHVSFAPGFADRVMARIAATPRFSDALQAVFLRLTPVAVAAALLSAAVNLVSTRATNAPIAERMMGLSAPIGEVSGSTAMAHDVWGADLNSWGNHADEN